MPKMSERKVIIIVLFVAAILVGYYQLPDTSSSIKSLHLDTLIQQSSPPPSKTRVPKKHAESNEKNDNNDENILAAPKAPRSPRQAVLRVNKKSIRRYNPASCVSKSCGCAMAQAFGNLNFISLGEDEMLSSSYEAMLLRNDKHPRVALDYRIFIAQISGNTSQLSWSARAKSQQVLFGVVPRKLDDDEVIKLSENRKEEINKKMKQIGSKKDDDGDDQQQSQQRQQVVIAAWEFNFWLQETEQHQENITIKSNYDIDILLTWIEDKFIGTKWNLPNRDDNPPAEIKKKKCLDLQLIGDCERFGLTIINLDVALETPRRSENYNIHNNSDDGKSSVLSPSSHPICKSPNQVASQGAWHRISETELQSMQTQERELIDDFVGLNRFEGGVWRWQPRHCHLKWLAGANVVSQLIAKGLRQITLFGDSMLLEQFHNFKKLLDPSNVAQIRTKTQNKMRFLSFTTSGNTQDRQQGDTDGIVTVTFLRSYTTSKGKSVIASPKVIASQVAATRPDIIIGNAAVLHWQQNMRSFAEWNANIDNLAQRLCSMTKPVLNHFAATTMQHPDTRRIKNDPRITPTLFYFGPTLIQMGRTQGLEPLRTSAFGEAAREAFEKHCKKNNEENDLTTYKFAPFWMYNASIARRESAHDGQHWACYREWGGVAQTFTQNFFNMVLN